MNEFDRHNKRKSPFTIRFFEEEKVVDKEGGYTSYKQLKIKELFGFIFHKGITYKNVTIQNDRDEIKGFRNGFRQNSE